MTPSELLKILPDILDELNEIVYIHDADWNVIYANKMAREIFGYDLGKVNLREVVAEEYLPKALERFKEILRSRKPLRRACRISNQN